MTEFAGRDDAGSAARQERYATVTGHPLTRRDAIKRLGGALAGASLVAGDLTHVGAHGGTAWRISVT